MSFHWSTSCYEQAINCYTFPMPLYRSFDSKAYSLASQSSILNSCSCVLLWAAVPVEFVVSRGSPMECVVLLSSLSCRLALICRRSPSSLSLCVARQLPVFLLLPRAACGSAAGPRPASPSSYNSKPNKSELQSRTPEDLPRSFIRLRAVEGYHRVVDLANVDLYVLYQPQNRAVARSFAEPYGRLFSGSACSQRRRDINASLFTNFTSLSHTPSTALLSRLLRALLLALPFSLLCFLLLGYLLLEVGKSLQLLLQQSGHLSISPPFSLFLSLILVAFAVLLLVLLVGFFVPLAADVVDGLQKVFTHLKIT